MSHSDEGDTVHKSKEKTVESKLQADPATPKQNAIPLPTVDPCMTVSTIVSWVASKCSRNIVSQFEGSFAAYASTLVWAASIPVFASIFIRLFKLMAVDGISLARSIQCFFITSQLINAILALRLHMCSHTTVKLRSYFSSWQQQRKAHKYLMNVARLLLQISYSYVPLSSDKPQIDQLAHQLLLDGMDLITENEIDRNNLFFSWAAFPIFLFLDWRYAFLNGLLLSHTEQNGQHIIQTSDVDYYISSYIQNRGVFM